MGAFELPASVPLGRARLRYPTAASYAAPRSRNLPILQYALGRAFDELMNPKRACNNLPTGDQSRKQLSGLHTVLWIDSTSILLLPHDI